MSQKTDVLKVAQEELGYTEKDAPYNLDSKEIGQGSGNYTKYWRDLKPSYQGQPWCQAFIVWIFVKALGEKIAKELLYMTTGYNFYTPDCAQFFNNKKRFFTNNPKVADIVYFRSDSSEKQGRWRGVYHVGIIYKVDPTYIYTIEGNTSPSDGVVPNGGGVYAKKHKIKNDAIAGYARPEYAEDSGRTVEPTIDRVPIQTGVAGLKIVGTSQLNIRKYPDSTSTIVGTYRCGQNIHTSYKAQCVQGGYWFETDKGWISGKYLEGWLMETNKKWWRIEEGYTYPQSTVKEIEGKEYAFDHEGYMLTSDRLKTDGSIKY